MDCKKLAIIVKRWGYNAAHQYLIDIYGLSPKEVEECIKGVGIDLGHWPLYALPGEADYGASAVSWLRQKVGGHTSNSPSFV
jgi:glycerol kinase